MKHFSTRYLPVFPIVALTLLIGLRALSAQERLSPSGLAGAVLLVPSDKPDEKAISHFARLAGGAEAKVALITLGEKINSDITKSLETALPEKTTSISITTREQALQEASFNSLQDVTAVWLDSSLTPQALGQLLENSPLATELQTLLRRGGTLAASGQTVSSLATAFVDSERRPGMNVLAGVLVDTTALEDRDSDPFASAHNQSPGLLGLRVAPEASLLLRGREIRQLSPGDVTLRLATGSGRAEKNIPIDPSQSVDYNEALRAARGRAQPPFPPQTVGVPEVAAGSLVIVGGGGMPRDIGEKFVALGGGVDGRFVVFPTSMPDPLPPDAGAGFLERFGAKHVTIIKVREQAELETPENLAILKEATGIWFGGGRQWRFVDAYAGTTLEPLMHDVLKRGGVVGGSSAGATILGEYLVRGAPAGPHIMMCEGYERGLNFLPGVAIDQHFSQRKRFFDMSSFMKTYPQYLGIGIDESTALIVQGHTAEIMGKGAVHFYDWRTKPDHGDSEYTKLLAGERYDLKARTILKLAADSAPPTKP